MRDQIITGITQAIDSHPVTSSPLHHLTDGEVNLLADHILTALATTPEGTPAPQATVIEADTPALTFTAADVVAMLATQALRHPTPTGHTEDVVVDNEMVIPDGAVEDYRVFREFVFATQAMFGVRVRYLRPVDGGNRRWVVAGTRGRIDVFLDLLNTFYTNPAAPSTHDASVEDQATFWATLGALVTDTDRARTLIAEHADASRAATAHLVTTYGPARTLPRATPATDGEVHDLAARVAATAGSPT